MARARILVAPDSFKGTFSAAAVAAAMARGAERGEALADVCPVADGGEGTIEALMAGGTGRLVAAPAHDPLGRPIEARFALLEGGRMAVVECASASGLALLAPEEREPVGASTRGTGELIVAAGAAGATEIVVAVGGSSTTDGGAGALEAIAAAGGLSGARLTVLCDVTIPWEQAAPVFAPQKGADPATVSELERRMDALARHLPRDPRGVRLGGAAGGLAGGLWAALDARLLPGADYVLEAVGFEQRLDAADLVLVGEGRLDEQSFMGKIAGRIVDLCREHRLPVHAISGSVSLPRQASEYGLSSASECSSLDAIAGRVERIVQSAATAHPVRRDAQTTSLQLGGTAG